MISVKNIAGIICFFAYSKTTEKEKCRMQKEKYRRRNTEGQKKKKHLENLRPASILERMKKESGETYAG